MNDTQKLDQILDRLTKIEKQLAETLTFETLATREDVEGIAAAVNYVADTVLEAEQRRDLAEIRQSLRERAAS